MWYGYKDWFQSLLGFLMRCDSFTHESPSKDSFSFNPCWVFWCVATSSTISLIGSKSKVSIPAGFSDALRQYGLLNIIGHYLVSIPAGFSDALRRSLNSRNRSTTHRFNPCWVFWCVATSSHQALQHPMICFNPCWVFWCVATFLHLRDMGIIDFVSIPAGFSDALRHFRNNALILLRLSFNPCWVFWCVATILLVGVNARR